MSVAEQRISLSLCVFTLRSSKSRVLENHWDKLTKLLGVTAAIPAGKAILSPSNLMLWKSELSAGTVGLAIRSLVSHKPWHCGLSNIYQFESRT